MRAKLILSVLLPLFFIPIFAFASCSSNGYTVVYINGILTNKTEAEADKNALENEFSKFSNLHGVTFLTAYNPTHLDGWGDKIKSVEQIYHSVSDPFDDFDLTTMLNQIASHVTTQKILLVGYSQGTFYANAMYDYLTQKGGVDPTSIAVYNIATPASGVAGGGAYLTSSSDGVIYFVRQLAAEANAPAPLPANILIPIPAGEAQDAWTGHHFYEDYLNGAGARIVGDMQSALGKLAAQPSQNAAYAGCFIPPGESAAYKAKASVFAVADPAAHGIDTATVTGASAVGTAAIALAAGEQTVQSGVNSAIASAFYSIFPRPTVQNAGTAFSVAKALYGSSLTEDEYKDLLAGDSSGIAESAPPHVANVASTQTQAQIIPSQKEPSKNQTQPIVQVQSPPQTPPAPMQPLVPVAPGYGGGGGAQLQAVADDAISIADHASDQGKEYDTNSATDSNDPSDPETGKENDGGENTTNDTSPDMPHVPLAFSIMSPDDGASFATTSITFAGTTSPSASVIGTFGTTTATSTADVNGSWSLAFTLPEGTTSVAFLASIASSISATSTRTIGISIPHAPISVSTSTQSVPSCGQKDFSGDGYFFPANNALEYSTEGFPEFHFHDVSADGALVRLFPTFFDEQCTMEYLDVNSQRWLFTLPADAVDWSIRFSSSTHLDVWDDRHAVIITSFDIPDLPQHSSVAFVVRTVTFDSHFETPARYLYQGETDASTTSQSAILVR